MLLADPRAASGAPAHRPVPGRLAGIRLVPGTVNDFGFLRAVHRAAMYASVARTVGWDDEQQGTRLRSHFAPATLWLICEGARRIGTIDVRRDAEGVHLSQFYLEPTWQDQGIGGMVLALVLADADAAGVPVSLRVLTASDARRLYERHGFVVTGSDRWQDHLTRPARPVAA